MARTFYMIWSIFVRYYRKKREKAYEEKGVPWGKIKGALEEEWFWERDLLDFFRTPGR